MMARAPFFTIFKIRLRQVGRILKTVGWGLLAVIIPLAFVFLLSILQFLQNIEQHWAALAFIAAFLTAHGMRGDEKFLQMTSPGQKVKQIYFFEYTLAALPFYLLFAAVLNYWLFPFFVQAGILVISFLKAGFSAKTAQKSFIKWTRIPVEAIEWRAGLRQNGAVFLLIWLGSLGLAYFTAAPLLGIFLCAAVSTAFFENLEPKEWILPVKKPGGFLFQKAGLHLAVFHCLMLPHYLAFLIFHFQYWYFLPAAAGAASLMLSFAIFYKYSQWLPGRLSANSGTLVGIFILFLLIPFLMPAVLLALVWAYRRARNQLRFFEI